MLLTYVPLRFALDLYPVLQGKRVDGVPLTAAGLLGWLGGNANLEVSKPAATSIGDLPATAVDIRLSNAAVNDDPGCPARTCVNFLGFPQWDHANGIAGDDVYRPYLADVRYSEPTMSSRSPSKVETTPTFGRSCQRWSRCWGR